MTCGSRRAAVCLALLAAVHIATITISPAPWQDEVQIVDLGRTFLDPDTTWSINWHPLERPVRWPHYLGAGLQESAYRLFAPSIAGPRLASLLGALVAAWLALLWLRQRGVPDCFALALAALLLIDPLFTQSYRGARVDCWAIACALAACVLVRRSAASYGSPHVAGAAALMVAAFFIWPSAVYLAPLVVAEGLSVTRSPAELLPRVGAATLGAVAGLAVSLIPLAGSLQEVLADMTFSAGQYYGSEPLLSRMLGGLRDTPGAFALSPLLPLLAVAGARYSPLLAIAAAVTLGGMVPSHIYVHRMVHLLPALIGIVGDAATRMPHRRAATWLIAIALVWAAGISLAVRPAQAWLFRDARSPANYAHAASAMPIRPGARVYLGAWDFYYAGRQQQWQMVHQFGDGGGDEALRRLLDAADVALLNETDWLHATLLQWGWRPIHQFELPLTGYSSQAALRRRYVLLERPVTP